jgi:hypothetical protein
MQEEDYAVLRSRGVEQLMASKEMKALRVAAQHKRLDLSDAFESSAGRGVNALIGEMPRNRFCSTLGGLFGGELKEDVLKAICAVYGCGDPDPVWGGYQEVWFKQFAVDFDKIEWRNKKAVGGANGISDGVGGMQEDELLLLQERGVVALLQSKEMRQLRQAAQHKKLDLSDAFEESCGKGLNAAMGEMARNRFGATLGGLFGGELSAETLKKICDVYGCGDVDHRTGLHKEVWFKQFANDFDGITPAPEREPVIGPELMEQLRILRIGAVDHRLDLTDGFESYAGKGREAMVGIMPKARFCSAMGELFKGIRLTHELLIMICQAYGTGDPDPREPGGYLKVQWKQFAIDFDNIPDTDDDSRSPMEPWLLDALSQLKASATQRRLDLTDAFEEYAGGGIDYNAGVMLKTKFRSCMAVLFTTTSLSDQLLDVICNRYAIGDPDLQSTTPGAKLKVNWKHFAIDFDDCVPVPPDAGHGCPPPRRL